MRQNSSSFEISKGGKKNWKICYQNLATRYTIWTILWFLSNIWYMYYSKYHQTQTKLISIWILFANCIQILHHCKTTSQSHDDECYSCCKMNVYEQLPLLKPSYIHCNIVNALTWELRAWKTNINLWTVESLIEAKTKIEVLFIRGNCIIKIISQLLWIVDVI